MILRMKISFDHQSRECMSEAWSDTIGLFMEKRPIRVAQRDGGCRNGFYYCQGCMSWSH